MPASMTACVASAEPVRMLHSVRSAGVRVLLSVRSFMMFIRRGTMPVWTPKSIRSSPPSVTYERAQHVSIRTSSSPSISSFASVGIACVTCATDGCGLPRIRLERAHTALRSGPICPIDAVASTSLSTTAVALLARTRSRIVGQSPAMLPIAHTACSHTSMLDDDMRATRGGTPPLETTASHWVDVPEAMLVRHHAASNWSLSSGWPSIVTNDGTRPALMHVSMGGLRASESCLRRKRTELSAASYSSAGPLRATKPKATCVCCSKVSVGASDVSGIVGSVTSAGSSSPMDGSIVTIVMLRRFCRPSSRLALRSSTLALARFLRQSSLSMPALTPRFSSRSIPMAVGVFAFLHERARQGAREARDVRVGERQGGARECAAPLVGRGGRRGHAMHVGWGGGRKETRRGEHSHFVFFESGERRRLASRAEKGMCR